MRFIPIRKRGTIRVVLNDEPEAFAARPPGRGRGLSHVVSLFRRMARLIIILLFTSFVTGCCCVRDVRGPSGICEIHHIQMRSETVRRSVGNVVPAPGYAEAQAKLFPHTIPSNYIPSHWPWQRDGVYVCDECVRAEKTWLQARQETK